MATDQQLPPEDNRSSDRDAPPPEPRTVRSEDLLRGDKEIAILHENQLYRLRRTRNGKLILQK